MTGLRRGEIPPLLWEDVADYIHIHREMLALKTADNGCITTAAVYDFYYRMLKKLDIPISRDIRKGPHSFRRTRETEIINKSGGNIIMAAQLFGHSTEVAKKPLLCRFGS